MSHGGARRGAGRKGGFNGASKNTQLAIRRWAKVLAPERDFADPALDVMRDSMMYHWRRSKDEFVQIKDYLEQHNATPEEMLKCVALYRNSINLAFAEAAQIAPFEAPKLSQVTIKTLDLSQAAEDEIEAALISMGREVDREAILNEVAAEREMESAE